MEKSSNSKTPLVYTHLEASEGKDSVLLIHGFALDHRIWDHQSRYLQEKGYGVLTCDLRGFGNSPAPDSPYQHHEDIKTLLDEARLEKVHLVGMSFGGEVAINFVLEYPDLVRSLTLLGSSLGGYEADPESPLSRWTKLKKAGKETQLRKEMESHPTMDTLERKNRKEVVEILRDYSLWHFDHPDPQIRLDPPATKRLNEISTSVSILVGENDSKYQEQIALFLHSNINNSQIYNIEGVGHFVNIEAPKRVDRFLELVLDPM